MKISVGQNAWLNLPKHSGGNSAFCITQTNRSTVLVVSNSDILMHEHTHVMQACRLKGEV